VPPPATKQSGQPSAPPSDKGIRPISAAAAPQPSAAPKDALKALSAQAPQLRRAVEQQSIVLQTARGLSNALKQGDGTVILNLQPPRLGQLKVHMTLQDAVISARIEPTSAAARQLLIDSEHSLRAALEARGLSVERIEVDAVKPPSHTIEPAPPQAGYKDDGPRPDHPGGESAGAWHSGGQGKAGSGAEAHTGDASDAEASSETVGAVLGSASVSYVLDNGGAYRLHLDALA
jgi:hypothetical protein